MSDEYRYLVQSIMEDGELVDIATDVLLEGDVTVDEERKDLFYMMMIEQLIDDYSCYAFPGWEDGSFYGAPRIGKFHVEVDMKFPKGLDMAPLRRIRGKNNENRILFKRDEDSGEITLRLRILRSQLDEIENRNRRIAKAKVDKIGYKAPTDTPQDPNAAMDPMAQGGMGGDDMFGGEDPFAANPMDDAGGGGPPGGGGAPF